MNDDLGEFVGKGFAILRKRIKEVEGRKAVNGIDGIDGKDGKDGKDGGNGNDGANGSNGLDGDVGRDGQDGRDGSQGDTGADGETIRGEQGDKGEQGEAGEKGELGQKGKDGNDGKDGKDAIPSDGSDGVGIADSKINTKGHLILTMTDGSKKDVGKVKGKDAQSYQGMIAGGPSGLPVTIVYVTSANQLSGALLSNVVYFIDGIIDMQSTQIIVPANGLNIIGGSFNTSCLQSSIDNYTMFIFDPASYAGDLLINGIEIQVTGFAAKVFDISNKENSGRISWNTINFANCTSIGVISSYGQALAQNVGWRNCADGVTVSGAWSGGWAILNSILLGSSFTGTLFKAGGNLTIGGSFRSNINLLLLNPASGVFCDFAPSNILLDAGFTLSNVRAPLASDALPNMPSTSVKVLIKDCVGIDNTFQGATVSPNDDSIIVINEVDTLVQITGAVTLSESYWFSVANTNGLQLDSDQRVTVKCGGILSFSGSSGAELAVQLRKFDFINSVYVNIGPEYKVTVFGTVFPLASNVAFSANTTLHKNDRVEVWVKNQTNTDDITLKSGGQFEVLER